MPFIRTALAATATVLVLGALSLSAAATEATDSAWPVKVVTFEDLKPLTPFRLSSPGPVAKGRVTGPTTLRVHVSNAGAVAKTSLLASCGNADLDEAAIHAMRSMRFQPYMQDGVAAEVTLVVPIHVPKRLGRAD